MKSILFIALLAISIVGCHGPEKSTDSDTTTPSTMGTDTTSTMSTPTDTTTPTPVDTTGSAPMPADTTMNK